MHGPARGGHIRAEALVVFHVTGRQLLGRSVIKLSKQIFGHLAHDVDQHIQAAAVRHAYDDFLHALRAGGLNQFVHGGYKAFSAFERETFLADVFGMQIALQALGSGQPVKNVCFLVR